MGDREAKAQPELRNPSTAEEEQAVRHHGHKLGIRKSRGLDRRHPWVLAELTNIIERPLRNSLKGHGNGGRFLMTF